MRSLLTYIMLFVALLGMAGCESHYEDVPLTPNNDYIQIRFAPNGHTRGTIDDNECEAFMSHLDVVIYKVSNEGATYDGFYHERVNVSATPDGVTSIKRTKEDFELGATYKVYVIANSDVDPSVYYQSGNIIAHDKFLKLDQTNRNIHLSGINFGNPNFEYPNMFLMDGIAYMGNAEPAQGGAIVINDGTTDDVTLKVTLRRAAAKIIVTIKAGDKVTFKPELMAQSQGYLLRNMPIRTTIVAEGGYPIGENVGNPYWASPTISQSPYFQLVDDGKGGHNMVITAYCYSHTWKSAEVFKKGTSLVVNLPMIYKESKDSPAIEYIHNYYQISISKVEADGSTHLIKRNTLYDLRVNLNAPGAEDYTTPEEIKDLQYFTTPWQEVDIPVSGENTVKYLKVNKNKLYMYYTDTLLDELYFSSSSPVTVKYVDGSAYYKDKYNNTQYIKDNSILNSIKGSAESEAISGNIVVNSAIPTNNTIRYFKLEVTNQEGMTEIINVEQYPLIYITNGLPWYSYRDDYYYRTTGGHKFRDDVITSTTDNNPTTYLNDGDRIVGIYQIESVDTENKTAKYTYTSAAPSNNHGWTSSKVRGNQSGNKHVINYYYFAKPRWGYGSVSKQVSSCETHNVRNYHVRVMATSGNYTVARPNLDENGYTAGDEDNAKLVSPSFVIASRLGAVLSTYSGLDKLNAQQKLVVFADHCKNYVEVDDVNDDGKTKGDVHDNWRLPTEAELNIIIELQGGDGVDAVAIDFLLNGQYYMSANGPVYNPKNTAGTNGTKLDPLPNKWNATDVAIRCVRDAY
ncbi:MAG: hypothetical protein IIV55_05205 [Alistipes sp.]|nr:hypothetical protein [Alistipes sp.]